MVGLGHSIYENNGGKISPMTRVSPIRRTGSSVSIIHHFIFKLGHRQTEVSDTRTGPKTRQGVRKIHFPSCHFDAVTHVHRSTSRRILPVTDLPQALVRSDPLRPSVEVRSLLVPDLNRVLTPVYQEFP